MEIALENKMILVVFVVDLCMVGRFVCEKW